MGAHRVKRPVRAVVGLAAAFALLAGCGGSHRTGTITSHVIFDRPDIHAVTARTHRYGMVKVLDSHGRLLQTRNVQQGYGHVPPRDRFQFRLDPGRYIVHLKVLGPKYLVPDRCPPLTRNRSVDVHVRQSAKVQLADACASY